ncbi:glucose-6-phosphate dehydrogenase [Chitinivibrio alkaliphilus]|uniref:Glucose-6-phosphate 1-dehydrogenase n=1 Tax=Chitinivibrio alkaliphilus ACht1 TaxID=1313304 RepID=U7DBQ7_9BACT|nr:glucose-6-phosphate dehydrogenase [Chitinivibrio alkaliphilus]ERP39018.1 glucose-6-phosphate 1-dehydrogenase [Chitinivibrio alkaliphilus ACht1]
MEYRQKNQDVPTAVVILGASGNLAQKKLIPALSMLFQSGKLPQGSVVVGTGRSDLGHEGFRRRVSCCDSFKQRMYYHQGMAGLKAYVEELGDFSNIVIFFSLPPHVYEKNIAELYAEGFRDGVKVVLEKPFGYDTDSARRLNRFIHSYYAEEHVYRIDHYLAKEAVQNILVFRFANILFEPLWNSTYIDSIQVNCFEDIGVEGRAGYFDSAGIVRDVVQNHLAQLLSLITMEPPLTFSAEDIRTQKETILRSLHIEQYAKWQAEEYLHEPGVPASSTTETYAELQLSVNTLRWSGVPVYIRAGKYMDRKGTEIGVRFKKLPPLLFNRDAALSQNQIIFKIQPAEGIILDLVNKTPGESHLMSDTTMRFCYGEQFQQEISEAYIKLLSDTIQGDKTLFLSAHEAEVSWEKFDRLLQDTTLKGRYSAGTIPPSSLGVEWIDFKKYEQYC